MEKDLIKGYIQRDLLVAIVYDDYSGCSDEEMELCHKFLEKLGKHISLVENSEEFEKCEITGLRGSCVGYTYL